MTITSKDIQKAVEILNKEELVAIPTETVYGLAGNIYSEKAIRKIFEMKNRPLFNPLIVHIHSINQLNEFISYIPKKALLLANAFWPGALTLVLKKKSHVPDLITSGKDSVAIRIPNHPVTLALLEQLNFPLAAPSANPFGCISPTKAIHVEEYFGNNIQMVLDGGNCKNGIESTIIGFPYDEPVVYRLGAISIEDIEKVVGKIEIKNKKESTPDAPGMLSKHYAPLTNTYLASNIEQFIKSFPDKKIGLLLFCSEVNAPQIIHQEILSKNGNLEEAATNLYSALHLLDKLNLDAIIAERLPDIGLGKSINDRLERATKK
ncbi:L-threonylcarbamoyladenylate synthase [Hymenobacter elongatus]|uniref:Threonylcarbamoyl-AMP synthase n=1 Tax=Hymenobacter elongatus TaxID=877208 RepID=A0A4Z0PKM9_9BACT|nr:L-threonylcarbamoyladenylate synthase [Hymenobacter elongatus]TGE15790.1 threonylcarbamoyl-AMP synthase [Hymenobacter elongatus]